MTPPRCAGCGRLPDCAVVAIETTDPDVGRYARAARSAFVEGLLVTLTEVA